MRRRVVMTTLSDEILDRLRADRPALEPFGVQSVALFGSCARGDAGPDCDVAGLVHDRPDRHPDVFDFIDLQAHLPELTGRPVDRVTAEALHDPMRSRIRAEAADA